MKYPIVCGEILRIETIHEYHVVNQSGVVIHIFDDLKLAEQRFANFGIGCHLVRVTKSFTILKTHKPAKLEPSLKVVA
jgi:hypothetical protein